MSPGWSHKYQQALQYFHFLRPEWALLLIPLLLIALVQARQGSARDMFGGIIAPHLLAHLRLKEFKSRWLNPRSLSLAFVILALLVTLSYTAYILTVRKSQTLAAKSK